MPKIKEEIERMLKARFIRTTKYADWLSNTVLEIKKSGQVTICTDFRDMNLAIPKDECIMAITDMLVNAAASNSILTFMDGYSGYNQIFIEKRMSIKLPSNTQEL